LLPSGFVNRMSMTRTRWPRRSILRIMIGSFPVIPHALRRGRYYPRLGRAGNHPRGRVPEPPPSRLSANGLGHGLSREQRIRCSSASITPLALNALDVFEPYVEARFHGDVEASAIGEVIFRRMPPPELQTQLAQCHIPWRVSTK